MIGCPEAPRALYAKDIRVTYPGVVAVRDASLAVHPGEFVAVTGPSGAGKTSLLWALAGAVHPARGSVTLGDDQVTDRVRAGNLGIAVIPQGNGLALTLTASENVTVPMLVRGTEPGEARRRAQEALAGVGLAESGNHLIEELSGGQQQRVAVARALAGRSAVILADEPTSDLDSASRARVVALLRERAASGAIVVMATHDPEAAAATDAEIALDEGALSWARPLDGSR